MSNRPKRYRAPAPEPLSMDWFAKRTPHDLLEKSFLEDPRGCHSNLEQHQDGERMCAETMGKFGITNPRQFLERWTTSEILSGLDTIIGLESAGNKVENPGAWLWSYLEKEDEKAV